MLTSNEFQLRRNQLIKQLDSNTAIILFSAPQQLRNGDVHYPYRQDSDFYYLTGFPEWDALVLLLSEKGVCKAILFNRAQDSSQALWEGSVIGQKQAVKSYGFDQAHPLGQLEQRLGDYLGQVKQCYFLGHSDNKNIINRVGAELKRLKKPICQSKAAALKTDLHEMRLIKSSAELACLQKAAQISSEAHKKVMQFCRPNQYEYQLEGELLYHFYQSGIRDTAYPSIVASGENACILHYTQNKARLRSGDLILIDAGCEYENYASDITRTFPVNGRFSSEQKALYTIVLNAQQAVIELIKPDLAWNKLQACCVKIITEGLCELGLLKGKVNQLIEQNAYKKFYMHGCSHWLGLDVHDVGNYKKAHQWRHLQPNMVFTVEPGIYVSPSYDVPEKWWNIGIRIEDDVCVTAKGCNVLSKAVPKTIPEIEAFMQA